MIVLLPSRGLAAAALAAGLLLAGCSSDSDVPPTEVSAPGGGTQMNTDTGSGGTFPDVNTVPYQRPTSTIQDLVQAPDGLGAAQGGTQYSDALIGGPTSSAAPPPPPPPPEPPQEALAPIPEPGIQTDTSDAPEPVRTPSEPVATPEVVEPEPVEQSVTAAPEPVPESAGQGQTIQGTIAEPAPSAVPEPEPAAPEVAEAVPAEPVPAAPAPVAAAPQEPAAPMAPQPDPAAAAQQAQLPPSGYQSDPQAADPTAYGISVPGAPSPSQPEAAASPAARSAYGGEPVGMIYFREGSSSLSADDLQVLQQIAGMQRTHGGIINVVGHASVAAEGAGQAGLQDATQQISEARAVAVAQGLMQYGVPQSAIRTSGAGALEPLQSEAANRRAEVYLTGY